MNKKTIVFIPEVYYISNPSYFNLAEHLKKKYHLVYYNTNEPFDTYIYNKDHISKAEVLKYFDEYAKIEDKQLHHLTSNTSRLLHLPAWYAYKREVEQYLREKHPAAIVCSTDIGTFTLRVANEWGYRNHVPFLILQSTQEYFIGPKDPFPLKTRVLYLFFNKLLRLPFSRWQKYVGKEFGRAYRKNILLAWNEHYQKLFSPMKSSLLGNYCVDIVKPQKRMFTVIATQASQARFGKTYFQRWLDSLVALVRNNPKERFIVKVHPREDIKYYEAIFSSYKNCKVVQHYDLQKLIAQSKLFITINSALAFNFIMNDVPLLLFDFPKEIHEDFFNHEIELRGNDPESMQKQFKAVLAPGYRKEYEKKRKKYLKTYLGEMPTKEKTLDVFEQIVGC